MGKENRLTKKKDFEVAFKKGQSVKSDFLICKIVKNNLPESRFGFVVSKKVSSKATDRNKAKRRLRDAVFLLLPEIKHSFDVIIITLPETNKKDFSQIQKAVANSFKKLKLT